MTKWFNENNTLINNSTTYFAPFNTNYIFSNTNSIILTTVKTWTVITLNIIVSWGGQTTNIFNDSNNYSKIIVSQLIGPTASYIKKKILFSGYSASNYTFNGTTQTIVNWIKKIDTVNVFNISSGLFNVPISWLYKIHVTMRIDYNVWNLDNSARYISIVKNWSINVFNYYINTNSNTFNIMSISFTYMDFFISSETLNFNISGPSGSGGNIIIVTSDSIWCEFIIEEIRDYKLSNILN